MPSKVGLVRVKEKKKEDRKEETPKKSESKGKPETFDVEPTNPETEAIERCCPCVKTIRHKMWFKCIVFLAVSALNSADLVCDWLLFKDVIMIQEGLVYGPPEPAITWCLLAFSILGTFTFVFEIVNLWWEVFRENPWIDSDLASAITIWIEDVPQIALNVAIVVCREEAISYFQLVKASVLIFGICIRLIVSFVRYCSKDNLAKTRKNTKWAHQHIAYRVFIMFGLIIIFSGSVTVFLCTQFERSLDGNIKFNIPHTLFEEKYDDERYFDNVSMYFNHPFIDFSTDKDDANWVRLITLYDVREKETEIFKIEYDKNTKTKFIIWQTGRSGSFDAKECYTIDKTAKSLTKGVGTCATFISGNKESFIFRFNFIQRKIPDLIFGDIEFNSKFKNGTTACQDPDVSIVTDLSRRQVGTAIHPVIHYYRTRSTVTQEHHTIWTTGNSARFFKNQDLIDITSVWKTGFGYCESSGSLAPHLMSGISVNCTI